MVPGTLSALGSQRQWPRPLGEDCAILQVGSLENAQKPMHRMQAPSTERNGLILEYFGYLRRTPASIWGPTGTTFMDSS